MNRLLSLFVLSIIQLVFFSQAGWAADDPIPLQQVQEEETKYTLTLNTIPANAGTFNRSSGETFTVGQSVYMYYYANTDYVFEYWQSGDTIVSRDHYFYFTMPDHDATLTAVFRFDPGNPGNPNAPDQTKKYTLTLNTKPANAGSFNRSSGEQFTAGQSVSLRAYNNTDFVFSHWMENGEQIASNASFNYTMPAHNAELTAVYNYQPGNPANPDTAQVYYTVTLETKPANAGTFNWSTTTQRVAGSSGYVYAYANSDFVFREWQQDGRQIATTQRYDFQMPAENIKFVAVYDYVPANPGNPGKNYWNEETGEVIVDDFTPGSLSSAVNNTIGGSSNRDKVQMMTIAGSINQNDWGVVNNYKNCTLLDLSRTYGMSYVPSYNFSGNSVLTSVALPAGIEKIDYYAFRNCSSLSSISIYADTPPEIGTRAFEGIADSIVYVPAEAIPLYQEADGWKDFTILPLAKNVSALEVNLPEGTDVATYKDMFIELVNTKTGQRQRYVITNRLTYTFNSLIHLTSYNLYLRNAQGDVLGEVDGIDIIDKDVSVTFPELKVPRTLTLRVLTPTGEDVTSQATITWFDQKDTYLTKGNTLTGQLEGVSVKYRVQLPQTLAMQYLMPTDVTYEVQAQNNISLTLAVIPQTAISGRVLDVKTGQPLSGATVSVSQMLNGLYSKSFTTKTDNKGQWSLQVYEAKTDITASMDDYVSKTQTFEAPVVEVPDFLLKDINGTTITLNLTYTTTDGETQDTYSDYTNVAYEVFNETTQQTVNELNVQYPQIVLMEQLPANTVLRVTATSKNQKFMPVTATATVDELDRASVTLGIKQLGGIVASFRQTDNMSVAGKLYDYNGRLVKKYDYTTAMLTISELQDGQYTLVTMANSQFFNSIGSITQFTEAGLKVGVDYVKNTVTVKSGEMTVIENPLIPYFDETKLYYTSSNTSVTVNKSQITTGNYLTLTSKIDFKSAYANSVSDVKLIVNLPAECSFVENSVMRGSVTASYTFSGNTLTVPLDYYGERVRFCFIPTVGGEFNASASVQFTLGGKIIVQPIGSANFTVKDLSITVPSTVAKANIPVSGTANGKATVKIYDGDVLIGQTTSLANGIWSTTCELYEPENLSTHNIYAVITTKQGLELQTETVACVYDEDAVMVNTVTMINTAHTAANLDLYNYVTVFDFQNPPTSIPPYWYWPNYPDFTFLIDISYSNINIIPYVWLHVFTSDGNVRSLSAVYDEKRDSWVATDKFWSEALPVRVSVTIENMVFDPSNEATYEILMDEYIGDITYKETIEGEDGNSTSCFTDGNGNDIATVTAIESELTPDELVEKFKLEGFEEDESLNDHSDYVPEDEDDTMDEDVKVLVEPKSGSLVFIGAAAGGSTNAYAAIVRIIREEDKKSVTTVTTTITRNWKSFYRTYFEGCNQVTEYKNNVEYLDRYVTVITSTLVSHAVFIDYRVLPPGTKVPKKIILGKIRRTKESAKRRVEYTIERKVVPIPGCPPPPPPPIPPVPPVPPVMDPSGYVYEGVPSNRLQGVMATAYYKETVEDMYGDLHENVVLWDAEEYAQENPLFTDEYGMYQWDVPQGLWQVKFEKEGYQTTYSEWLPVPPPQLEVNIAMTQMLQPSVKGAKAYDEGIEVEFDKYMDPETLNSKNIMVTKNGKAVSGTVELLNEEVAYEGQSQTYASKVRFAVPEGEEFLSTDEVQLTIRKAVNSYAGVPMQDDYTQKFDVEPRVRRMAVDSLVNIGYGAERTITVAALPADASKGKKVTVKSLSTMIVTTDCEELTLDENGQAELKISGELPGSTVISFKVEDTDVEGMTTVVVKDAALLVTVAPRASRVSGTEVYRGTEIRLTSETEGAEIWYTLDGSCPCNTETALKYNPGEPIIIAGDSVKIKAIAIGHDLAESDISEFSYTLKTTALGYQLSEGWTWVSHNIEEGVPSTAFATNAERIVGQRNEMINDPVFGLVGGLSTLQPTEGYKLKLTSETSNQLKGYEFNARDHYVPLKQGWNWIGYPVNQAMTLSEALAYFEASEGDYLVGQDGYAEYIDGKWQGTLEGMMPGQGFVYKSATTSAIPFNTAIVSTASSRMGKRNYLIGSPWAPAKNLYPNVMPLTAEVYNEGVKVSEDDYVVGAFAESECRGVGQWKNGRLLMTVYGDLGEDIRFVATQRGSDRFYDITEHVNFTPDNIGSWHYPMQLTLGSEVTAVRKTFDGQLSVTPAVAHDYVTVSVGGRNISHLTFTAMNGQTVISVSNVGKSATIATGQLPDGIYIVTVQAEGQSYYKKVLKANN